MRPHKPWYRSSRNAWFVEVHGQQFGWGFTQTARPKKTKAGWSPPPVILDAFYKLMADQSGRLPEPKYLSVAVICDLFLRHSEKHNSADTFAWYKHFLQSFCDACGTVPALEVKPFHVSGWLDANPSWTTGRRNAVICVKRAFNWAEGEGLLPTNPLKKVRKPPSVARNRILTPNERQEILSAIKDQQFRDFVFALHRDRLPARRSAKTDCC